MLGLSKHELPRVAQILRSASLQRFIGPRLPPRSWRRTRNPPTQNATSTPHPATRFTPGHEPRNPQRRHPEPRSSLSWIEPQASIGPETTSQATSLPSVVPLEPTTEKVWTSSEVSSPNVDGSLINKTFALQASTSSLATSTAPIAPNYSSPLDHISTESPHTSLSTGVPESISTAHSSILHTLASGLNSRIPLPGTLSVETHDELKYGNALTLSPTSTYPTTKPVNLPPPQLSENPKQPTCSSVSFHSDDDEMTIEEGEVPKHPSRWQRFDIRMEKRRRCKRKPRWSVLTDPRPVSISPGDLFPHESVRFHRMYSRYRSRKPQGEESRRQPFFIFKKKTIEIIRSSPRKPASTYPTVTAFSPPFSRRWPNPVYDEDTEMVSDSEEMTDPHLTRWVQGVITGYCAGPPNDLHEGDVDMQDAFDARIISEPEQPWYMPDDPFASAPRYPPLSEFVPTPAEVENLPPMSSTHQNQSPQNLVTTGSHVERPSESVHVVLDATPSSTQSYQAPSNSPGVSESHTPPFVLPPPAPSDNEGQALQPPYTDVSECAALIDVLPEPDDAGLTGIPQSSHTNENDSGELLTRQLDQWEQEGKAEAEARRVTKGKFKATETRDEQGIAPGPPSSGADAILKNVDLSSLTLAEAWVNYPELLYKQQRIFDQVADTIGLSGACAQLSGDLPTKPRIEQSGSVTMSSSRVTVEDLDYRTGRASNLAEHETSIYLLDDANNSSDSEYESDTTTEDEEYEEDIYYDETRLVVPPRRDGRNIHT